MQVPPEAHPLPLMALLVALALAIHSTWWLRGCLRYISPIAFNPADGLAVTDNRTCNSDSETAAGQPGRRPEPRACKSAAIAGFGEGQGCWQPAGRRCCGRHCLGRCRGWPVHLLSRKAGRAASRVRIARKIRTPRSVTFDDVQIEGLRRAWSPDGLPGRYTPGARGPPSRGPFARLITRT